MRLVAAAVLVSMGWLTEAAQHPVGPKPQVDGVGARPAPDGKAAEGDNYVLGPDDIVMLRVLDLEELNEKAAHIDLRGEINLPLAGRVKAAGFTAEELEGVIRGRLLRYLRDPQVSVTVTEYKSQPVSILGAVAQPGVHQVRGRKTLFELLSLAGGLKPEAGNTIKITRRKEWGPIPLPGAAPDPSGRFTVGQVSVRSVMDARNPEENILIRPYDVISVPKGDMVYVIGSVKRAGGFVLNEQESFTVLQALALAEGLERTASPKNAKILRGNKGGAARAEVPVDVQRILSGRSKDVPLAPNDILFIPNSATKSAALRSLEAAVQMGTGVVIYRR